METIVVKIIGYGLLLAGLAGLLVSLGLVGTLIWDAWAVHEAYRRPIVVGREHVTPPFRIRGDALLQIGVRARIEGDADLRLPGDSFEDDTDYSLLHEFPVRYVVTAVGGAGDGDILVDETTSISGRNHTLTHVKSVVRRDGGWIHGTFWFDKIEPGTAERIRVRIQVDPDATHDSTINGTELIVADDARPVFTRIVGAIAAFVLALLSLVVGACCVVVGPSPPRRNEEFETPTA